MYMALSLSLYIYIYIYIHICLSSTEARCFEDSGASLSKSWPRSQPRSRDCVVGRGDSLHVPLLMRGFCYAGSDLAR